MTPAVFQHKLVFHHMLIEFKNLYVRGACMSEARIYQFPIQKVKRNHEYNNG